MTNSFELEIKDPGIYELKYRDAEGKESDVKEIYAYVKDGLQLYFDGEYNENYKHNEAATTWKDLSGNGNDIELNENHKFGDNSLNCEKVYGAYSQSKNNVLSDSDKNLTAEAVAKFNSNEDGWIWSIRDTAGWEGIQLRSI